MTSDELEELLITRLELLEARLTAAREVVEAVDLWLWNEELEGRL